MWIVAAMLSAIFAGITSILAKCGIKKTDSDIATALRTIIVLIFSWVMVAVVGSGADITSISSRSLFFILLSGFATGASWLCYFKALSLGDVNKVVPIDKSATILTVLFAIIVLGEVNNIAVKLLSTILIGIGIFMMIEKKDVKSKSKGSRWIIYAVLSAVFAAATSILAKIGISGVESNLATAIRTCVVLIMAWIIVFMQGKQKQLKSLDKKELIYIALSGLATGASWICYYYAIGNGIVSVVVPIDKMSILVSVIFSGIVFKERLNKKSALGLGLMLVGTVLMAIGA